MRRTLGWTAAVLYALFVVLVLRPHGDQVLATLSGGTRAGAFLIGCAVGWLPAAAFLAAWFSHQDQVARGVPADVARPTARMNVLLTLSLAPGLTVMLLDSRNGGTPLALSPLFDPLLAGMASWGVPLALLGIVLLAGRGARRVRQWMTPPPVILRTSPRPGDPDAR